MTSRAALKESEERVRAQVLASLDKLCPYIIGNPFIPHFPHAKQWRFLAAGIEQGVKLREDDEEEAFEALYGGAAGGGKSDALLMALGQFAWLYPEFRAVCFRRTSQDLNNPGALLDRAHSWWNKSNGVEWNGTKSRFTFPSGAVIKMGHMSQPDAHLDHQGSEYHNTVWDELTQHPTPRQYQYVGLSRVRRNTGCCIPLRTLGASNPGGPGHSWVKGRFVTGYKDPETGVWIPPRLFIPATLDDNPSIDRGPYVRGLMHLPAVWRDQLLKGDWDAREPGAYFQALWLGPLLDAVAYASVTEKMVVRWWDLAAGTTEEHARTAGVKMAKLRRGVKVIENAVAFRATPGARNARIAQVAQSDGPHVVQGFEIEPGSGGLAQVEELGKIMRGLGRRWTCAKPKVQPNPLQKLLVTLQPVHERGKLGRAAPFSSCLERGHQRRGECEDEGSAWWGLDAGADLMDQKDGIRCVAGSWNEAYFDEMEGVPAGLMDFMDASSAANNYLDSRPWGLRVPAATKEAPVPVGVEVAAINPAVRPKGRDTRKDRGGHWAA